MNRASQKNRASYRVIYGDTDQMGVAYYANYLRWFELGRTEWLRQIGVPYTQVEENGLRFPVTYAACRYHRPARYDDEIIVETTLSSVGRASLVFRYEIFHRGTSELIATGETKHACVDARGQITRIPGALGAALSAS